MANCCTLGYPVSRELSLQHCVITYILRYRVKCITGHPSKIAGMPEGAVHHMHVSNLSIWDLQAQLRGFKPKTMHKIASYMVYATLYLAKMGRNLFIFIIFFCVCSVLVTTFQILYYFYM